MSVFQESGYCLDYRGHQVDILTTPCSPKALPGYIFKLLSLSPCQGPQDARYQNRVRLLELLQLLGIGEVPHIIESKACPWRILVLQDSLCLLTCLLLHEGLERSWKVCKGFHASQGTPRSLIYYLLPAILYREISTTLRPSV